MTYRLGVDIGGTKIHVAVVAVKGEAVDVIAVRRIPVDVVYDLAEEIREAAEDICCEKSVPYGEIAGCGVGVPGTVSRDGTRVLKAPNITLLDEGFYGRLTARLGMPVSMVQDSRAAALGEYLCGGGRGCDTLICMTLGTGIGVGIVMNGEIYHGALGAAGELGHLPVVRDGRPCGCGKRGCLEKYCAGGGLDITARELLGEGKGARELFSAAREGNAEARTAIADAIVMLGNAVVAAINLLSPNCVLFSGGLCEERDLLDPLVAYVNAHAYSSGELPRIGKAELGEFAPLVGAALYHK